MKIEDIKKDLLVLIGNSIDEATLPSDANSFVEMDYKVIHCSVSGGEHYFEVKLEPTTEDSYFKK